MFDLFKNKNNDENKNVRSIKNNVAREDDVWNEFAETFKNFKLSEFMLRVVNSKISFDELNDLFSKDIDKIIINARKEGLKFIGGIFKIELKDEKNFRISFQLFFKNVEGKFLTKAAESDDMLLEYLTEEAQKELKDSKVIEFEIDEP